MTTSRLEPAPSPDGTRAAASPTGDENGEGIRTDQSGAGSAVKAAKATGSALALAALAACGGGGGGGDVAAAPGPDSSSAAPGPSPAVPQNSNSSTDTGSAAPAPAPAPPAGPFTDGSAARFLAQAGFAASLADIASVRSVGYAAWLDQQFAMEASQSNYDWLTSQGRTTVADVEDVAGVDNAFWKQWMSAPDQLRKRTALALSEIFVVSMAGLSGPFHGMAAVGYVDLLNTRAFGTYRELLEAVALSPGMGCYLNMLGSKKANATTGNVPDENFPREVMQLMTIGLVQLNLDGTPVFDASGQPVPAFTQTDVSNLAAVCTGWAYDGASSTDPAFMFRPMVNVAKDFSTGAKKVLSVDIPASADGPTAMKTALDTLANHANVGPFFCRQLIQRLVCSNPSATYVKRVASAFNNNGSGQRGDLKAVLRAVLLDDEARTLSGKPDAGKLREPVVRFIQWARSFNAGTSTSQWNIVDTSDPVARLGQTPMRSPSVFNFFRPGYVPPNSTMATNGVTAPEFQLCNESTVAGYLNFMQTVIATGISDVKPDYTPQLALAADAVALVANVALLMAGDGLSDATLTTISNAVAKIGASNDAGKLLRVQAAIMLVMACPEYLIQK